MSFNEKAALTFLLASDKTVTEAAFKSRQLKDKSLYAGIAKNIELLVTNSFGANCEVNFYGSRIIGVGNEQSDLDIFVMIDRKTYSLYVSRFTDSSLLSRGRFSEHSAKFHKMINVLRSSPAWKVNKFVEKTAVPVICVEYLPMQLECDINILNGLGTQNSKLIAHLFELQPEAVKLYHFVRLWLKAHGFEHFKGYTITLLVIFYLQNKGRLPSSEKVHQNVYPKVVIDGWEVQFDGSRSLSTYDSMPIYSYKTLVCDFFKFYMDFDYDKVMSTHKGAALDLITYKTKHPKFTIEKGIYLPGPCNHATNCGIVDDEYKEQFISLCEASWKSSSLIHSVVG